MEKFTTCGPDFDVFSYLIGDSLILSIMIFSVQWVRVYQHANRTNIIDDMKRVTAEILRIPTIINRYYVDGTFIANSPKTATDL